MSEDRARLERAMFRAVDQLALPLSVRAVQALAARTLALYDPPPDLPKVSVQDLTQQQLAALLALDAGEQLSETAARLWITERTVREHRRKLFAKLGVSTSGEALRRARQLGLVRVDAGLPLPGQRPTAALR
ncbi:LuxR C-terminal-related transcriptional regulator [Streptomyces griseoluteus]|uniref:LuxR C-terminal-related transcriptional regulator n=1 Tax=Streptomyces griseoluteus TaxID=29306 RepID=UPI0037F1ED11